MGNRLQKKNFLLAILESGLLLLFTACPQPGSGASGPIINTVAGTIGVSGSTGDGGAATSATLDQPAGVCVDSAGNVFIADEYNHAIREVTKADGKIKTVAGTIGAPGSTGDGGPATSAKLHNPYIVYVDALGTIFIADTSNQAIREVK